MTTLVHEDALYTFSLVGARKNGEDTRLRCIAGSIHSHCRFYDLDSPAHISSMEFHVDAACTPSTISGAVIDRPLAVDFIDNRLPAYHLAFQSLPPFDPLLRKYTLCVPQARMQNHTSPSDPRPLWTGIFPLAMQRVKSSSTEPKELHGSRFRVRDVASWTQVQVRLQAAQESYIHTLGIRGWIRRSRRVLADNSHVAAQASRFLPSTDMTSPVINVVQNLLEVGFLVYHKRKCLTHCT